MVRKRDRGQDFALGKNIQYCRQVQVQHISCFFAVHVVRRYCSNISEIPNGNYIRSFKWLFS
jgi:hypothetical protein